MIPDVCVLTEISEAAREVDWLAASIRQLASITRGCRDHPGRAGLQRPVSLVNNGNPAE